MWGSSSGSSAEKSSSGFSMDKFSKLVAGEEKEPGVFEELNEQCTLTKKQRVYGFGICCAIGICITVISYFTFGNLRTFAILYSLGNIVALCSTGFLIGPCKQMKNMFKKKRMIATIVYLLSIIAVLAVAIAVPKKDRKKAILPLLLLCCIQFCALLWYTASYIPYARTAIKKCAGKMLDC